MSIIIPERGTIKDDSPDNVYVNISITRGNAPTSHHAEFSIERNTPVLQYPQDYEMTIARFSVPTTNIPIMVWGTGNYDAITNPASKVNRFSVTLSFDGVDSTKYLTHVPNVLSPDGDLYGPSVWNYQEFINYINVAFREAYVELKAAKPLMPPTQPPFVSYDASTTICTLNAQTLYNTGDPRVVTPPAATTLVYMNAQLAELMPGLQTDYTNDADKTYQFKIFSTSLNSATIDGSAYYQMHSEYSTVGLWNDMSTVVFETSSIPVSPEIQTNNIDRTRTILTDFEPSSNEVVDRSNLQYYGSGLKRYYDLKSHYPLRSIGIKVFWTDNWQQNFPLLLGRTDLLTLKILFRKKLSSRLIEDSRD